METWKCHFITITNAILLLICFNWKKWWYACSQQLSASLMVTCGRANRLNAWLTTVIRVLMPDAQLHANNPCGEHWHMLLGQFILNAQQFASAYKTYHWDVRPNFEEKYWPGHMLLPTMSARGIRARATYMLENIKLWDNKHTLSWYTQLLETRPSREIYGKSSYPNTLYSDLSAASLSLLNNYRMANYSHVEYYYNHIWGIVCQKQVPRSWASDYIPQILRGVITCPCLSYLLLAHKSSVFHVPCQLPIDL